MRRWLGEGWSFKFPTTSAKGLIWKVRNRLIQLAKQMQKIPAERTKAAAKAKAKAKAAPALPDPAVDPYDLEEELLQVKKITEANLKLADLKSMAEASIKQGSVTFYGCSRCRYNRGGCINYRCHPTTFGDHFLKFPEMYEPGTNRLKLEELKN